MMDWADFAILKKHFLSKSGDSKQTESLKMDAVNKIFLKYEDSRHNTESKTDINVNTLDTQAFDVILDEIDKEAQDDTKSDWQHKIMLDQRPV